VSRNSSIARGTARSCFKALRMGAGSLVVAAVLYLLFGLHVAPVVAIGTTALLIGVAVAVGAIWSRTDRLGVAALIERRTRQAEPDSHGR
jgi:hypothetical protein